MATKTIQIFLPGTHTAMGGAEVSFSENDLAACAAAYNPALHEAPMVIGHPAHDLPAYGWVESLRFVGGALEAVPRQVNPDFAKLVADGAIKKISSKFYRPNAKNNPVPGALYLQHVGFLGAQAPAVKGMRNPAFAEGDDSEFVTMELAFAEVPDTPDTPNTAGTADTAGTNDAVPEPAPAPAPKNPPALPEPPPPEPTVTPDEAAQLRQTNADLQARASAAEAALAAQADAARRASNTAFAEGLQGLIAADVPLVVELLHLAEPGPGTAPLAFGEGAATQPLGTALRTFLSALPARVMVGEQASQARAAAHSPGADPDELAYAEGCEPERLSQLKAIRTHMADKQVSYAVAALAVMTR